MDLNQTRLFLAGAAGMTGVAIIRHLLNTYPGIHIRGTFLHTPLQLEDIRLEPVRADLTIIDDCHEAVRGCDTAILAAARTYGAALTKERPWCQINDNLIMNTLMLQACHEVGVKRLIFISSSTVYQEFDGLIREDGLDLNRDPYSTYLGVGWVMRSLEKLCFFWHMQTGMEIAVARAGNIYGPFARFDPATSNVIPALIRKGAERMAPFEVWGTPEAARDLVFADDMAKALTLMLEKDEIGYEIFNIGSGKPVTVDEMVKIVLETADFTPLVRYNTTGPTTIPFRGLDCSKAANLLGWTASTSIRDGIAKTYEWWIENKERWSR